VDLSKLAPDAYIVWLTGFGVLIALVVWLPTALKRLPLSLPVICIAIGALLFWWLGLAPAISPLTSPEVTERLSELVVIIALMGAGLKIDRAFDIRRWALTWRLIGITMPLCIGAITVLGWLCGLPWISALLLGAALAPTDPVLASDVQVGPPQTGEEDEVRFGLTSEAGLNDGLAFPFVHLAIVLSAAMATGEPWFAKWLGYHVLWEIFAGIVGGWLVGRAFGWLAFRMPVGTPLSDTGDGLIAVAATFVSYGVTEMFHSYGFLAVFVTALTIRHADREHEYQREMHDITEQLERLAMMVALLLFGGALAGGLLAKIGWVEIGYALAVLFLIRPLAGLVSLVGSPATLPEKLTLSFFGIRGIGSIYYLAYALNGANFAEPDRLWAIVGLIVLLSVFLHGLTVTPAMRLLDRTHGRDPDDPTAPLGQRATST
jgi:NhaP-type Na+/H+ or K+/H+ antiporter